jgi:stress-induced morphogen
MFAAQEIENRIMNHMGDAEVIVKDLTGGQDHYEVHIVSKSFESMGPLQRHRAVYALFSDVVGGALHALSLKTQTPAEVRGDSSS